VRPEAKADRVSATTPLMVSRGVVVKIMRG
jgi:hypothetical protein